MHQGHELMGRVGRGRAGASLPLMRQRVWVTALPPWPRLRSEGCRAQGMQRKRPLRSQPRIPGRLAVPVLLVARSCWTPIS
jgi:hypothetical protein